MILTKRKHFESFRKSFQERTILDGDHCTPRDRTRNFSHSSLRISGVLSARVLLRTLRPTLRGAGDPGCDFGTQTWWGVKKPPPFVIRRGCANLPKGAGPACLSVARFYVISARPVEAVLATAPFIAGAGRGVGGAAAE